MRFSNVSRRYRRLHQVDEGYDVHHWLLPRRWENRGPLAERIVNHPANLNPIPRGLHQRIHNGRALWISGTPGWARGAGGSIVAGGVAEGFDGD